MEDRKDIQPHHRAAEAIVAREEIPAREKWLHQNQASMAAVPQGLADSAARRTRTLGSFVKYADDDADG
jgi:hypothetical protein